jgi:hypothetical protein
MVGSSKSHFCVKIPDGRFIKMPHLCENPRWQVHRNVTFVWKSPLVGSSQCNFCVKIPDGRFIKVSLLYEHMSSILWSSPHCRWCRTSKMKHFPNGQITWVKLQSALSRNQSKISHSPMYSWATPCFMSESQNESPPTVVLPQTPYSWRPRSEVLLM